jgi:hypothetical protein
MKLNKLQRYIIINKKSAVQPVHTPTADLYKQE